MLGDALEEAAALPALHWRVLCYEASRLSADADQVTLESAHISPTLCLYPNQGVYHRRVICYDCYETSRFSMEAYQVTLNPLLTT